MAIFKCKMCGGTIEFEPGSTVGMCDSCGTKQTLPKLDDDRRANLYDRANHFRRNNDFDKAAGIYEQILNEDSTDAEAYWSLVLCRFGIEYVEDPATHKRVPTVNRTQYTSIFEDEDYKSALQYADGYQRSIYEEEAVAINEIQKGILAISLKEEPFDVFICYKETDEQGRRTQDSVLANDLYHQLTQEGFKVFFSRITLEDKLGTAYEPYIFAALNSAKVMVVLGTKPEFFNAVWVKNEWSRYLALVKQSNGKKTLIPAYRNMDPYDLPDEFSHLQAQDMLKLGFMQDLIRGIKKLAEKPAQKEEARGATSAGGFGTDVAPLLKRAFMYLEDGNWKSANEYCERVLDINPENAQAYLGKLMSELQCRDESDLRDCEEPFDGRNSYQKAVRFGDEKLKSELIGFIEYINNRNENARLTGIYNKAKQQMDSSTSESAYKEAARVFKSISGFKDADSKADECLDKAEKARKDAVLSSGIQEQRTDIISSLEKAIELFRSISGWKDADERTYACSKRIEEIRAEDERRRLEEERKAEEARIAAEVAKKKIKRTASIVIPIVVACIPVVVWLFTVIIPKKINETKYTIAASLENNGEFANAAIAFGKLGLATNYEDSLARSRNLWEKVARRHVISCGYGNTLIIMADGTVKQLGYDLEGTEKDALPQIAALKDIISIDATSHSDFLALTRDGTVYNRDGIKATNAVAICGTDFDSAYLLCDGTVKYDQIGDGIDVSDWENIVDIAISDDHIVGLKADGTVVAVGKEYATQGQCDVSGWTDIVQIGCGHSYTLGLKSDGTVVYTGYIYGGDSGIPVTQWTDIVSISCRGFDAVGLKKDGTVVGTGSNFGKDDPSDNLSVSNWKNIIYVDAGSWHIIGIMEDGSLVSTYEDSYKDVGDVSGIKGVMMPE